MTRRSGFLAILVLGAALCGSAFAQQDGSALSPEAKKKLQEENDLRDVTGPVFYESYEGDFEVWFPSGCGTYREKVISQASRERSSDQIVMTVKSYCDREGRSGEGVSVLAYIDQDPFGGEQADAGFVLQRVETVLKNMGAEILQQQAIKNEVPDGPLMEGVDVLAADVDRQGQVWVRGLLVEGDVYILVAWRTHGPLATDPEIVEFFTSFRAHM